MIQVSWIVIGITSEKRMKGKRSWEQICHWMSTHIYPFCNKNFHANLAKNGCGISYCSWIFLSAKRIPVKPDRIQYIIHGIRQSTPKKITGYRKNNWYQTIHTHIASSRLKSNRTKGNLRNDSYRNPPNARYTARNLHPLVNIVLLWLRIYFSVVIFASKPCLSFLLTLRHQYNKSKFWHGIT